VHKVNGDQQAAGMSVAAAQERFRHLLWDYLIVCPKKKSHGKSVIEELERFESPVKGKSQSTRVLKELRAQETNNGNQ
jgi:hypothetical protein